MNSAVATTHGKKRLTVELSIRVDFHNIWHKSYSVRAAFAQRHSSPTSGRDENRY